MRYRSTSVRSWLTGLEGWASVQGDACQARLYSGQKAEAWITEARTLIKPVQGATLPEGMGGVPPILHLADGAGREGCAAGAPRPPGEEVWHIAPAKEPHHV